MISAPAGFPWRANLGHGMDVRVSTWTVPVGEVAKPDALMVSVEVVNVREGLIVRSVTKAFSPMLHPLSAFAELAWEIWGDG